MKTPRQILLQRHRKAEPKLDVLRRQVLAALPGSRRAAAVHGRPSAGLWLWSVLGKTWLELIWPSRRAWAAMAALWLGLLALNLQMKDGAARAPAGGPTVDGEIVRAVEERRRLLAELLQPAAPPSAQAQRPNPRPRSERTVFSKSC